MFYTRHKHSCIYEVLHLKAKAYSRKDTGNALDVKSKRVERIYNHGDKTVYYVETKRLNSYRLLGSLRLYQ
jgi:hypothetical protein